MLELDGITIGYGKTTAVENLTLRVEQGEAVSLVGPNGAGKTTTLSAVAGLLRPRSGAIRFEGREIAGEPPERLVRSGLALVPEGRQIFATLTVGENLRLPLAGTPKAEAATALARQLDRFPALAGRLDDPAGGLSGGQQQQLAIARALLCSPRLLLLDEPSLGLAPLLVDAVFQTLAELRDEGVTVLLVEQNAVRAVEFADRSYVINAGRLVLSGSREEIGHRETLAASYLGSTTAIADAAEVDRKEGDS
ncbi:MAG: ATP-binding cassette domain-containing protein [Actinobacteria bacterium]|nr:ATP-binding cassette domain-containing protein [Actinomycetota bacterium]